MKRRIHFVIDSAAPHRLELVCDAEGALRLISLLTKELRASKIGRESIQVVLCGTSRVTRKRSTPLHHPTRAEVEAALAKAGWTQNAEFQHIWYHPTQVSRWVMFAELCEPTFKARRKDSSNVEFDADYFRRLLSEISLPKGPT